MDSLSPFSQRFAKCLFGRYPDFRPYACPKAQDNNPDDALFVEVPPPPGGTAALYVDTFDEEVTVSFERWHSHYGFLPDQQPEADAFDHELTFNITARCGRVARSLSAIR